MLNDNGTIHWLSSLVNKLVHLSCEEVVVLCGSVMAVRDITGKAELQEAYELGKTIQ